MACIGQIMTIENMRQLNASAVQASLFYLIYNSIRAGYDYSSSGKLTGFQDF